jgi:hypothetical protein
MLGGSSLCQKLRLSEMILIDCLAFCMRTAYSTISRCTRPASCCSSSRTVCSSPMRFSIPPHWVVRAPAIVATSSSIPPIRRRLGAIVNFRLPHSNMTNSRSFRPEYLNFLSAAGGREPALADNDMSERKEYARHMTLAPADRIHKCSLQRVATVNSCRSRPLAHRRLCLGGSRGCSPCSGRRDSR